MENAHYENTVAIDSIKNDMLLILESAVFLPSTVIATAYSRRCGKQIETIFKPAVIATGLFFSPCIYGVVNNLCPITPG